MQSFNTVIPVSANGVSAGQTIDFKGETASSVVITNNSGFPIQYSKNASTFTTVANGATASIGGIDPALFRIRKAALDASPGYPVQVSVSWNSGDDEIRASLQSDGTYEATMPDVSVVGGSALGGLTAVQQAVFDALAPTVPDSYGPLGAPVVVTYGEASPVTFVQALDLACAIASVRPVNFVIDGIIPESAIAVNYEQWLYGNLMNLSIIGNPAKNTGLPSVSSVVSCASVGGGRYDLVLQHAAALPDYVKAGGMYLWSMVNPVQIPNSTWRGVSGAYLVKSVDRVNNRVTIDLQNDVALTVGAQVKSLDSYCGNVLPNVLWRVRAQVRQMSGFGVNGGSLLTQTESAVRGDGFLAVIPSSGIIAFDIGGTFGGYVQSLKLYAGTRAANGATNPYAVMENPGPTSRVTVGRVSANNFEYGLGLHDGAQMAVNEGVVLTNMATYAIDGLNWSDLYIPEFRVHKADTGVQAFAGAKVYFGGTVTMTDVTTPYVNTVGTLGADGSAVFQA